MIDILEHVVRYKLSQMSEAERDEIVIKYLTEWLRRMYTEEEIASMYAVTLKQEQRDEDKREP